MAHVSGVSVFGDFLEETEAVNRISDNEVSRLWWQLCIHHKVEARVEDSMLGFIVRNTYSISMNGQRSRRVTCKAWSPVGSQNSKEDSCSLYTAKLIWGTEC